MPDLPALLGATAAREKLWAIPGVLRIGFGLKEKAGEVLPQYVLRVYVAEKKPLERLTPEERIPSEVDGIPTDVVVLAGAAPQCKSAIKPGMQITREVYNTFLESGSIGCFVQKGGHFYILTAQHVFVPAARGDVRADVYQPSRSTVADVPCNNPAARVVGEAAPFAFKEERTLSGRFYYVDCGLLELHPGVHFVNDVPDVGTVAAAIRDLSTEPLAPAPPGSPSGAPVPASLISVRKRGATTGLTQGTVVELGHEVVTHGGPGQPPQTRVVWELQARVTSGKTYDKTFEISPQESRTAAEIVSLFSGESIQATIVNPASPLRIRFHGTLFSAGGDSGSVWLDESRRVIGLHWAGGLHEITVRTGGRDQVERIPNGRGIAAHASAVFTTLGLQPATAIVTGTHSTAGEVLHVPGGPAGPEPVPVSRVTELEEALAPSPRGRKLLAAVHRHQAEVRALIHHRRRVMVAWHRHKGPAFMAAVMNAVREGSRVIPAEVAGHRLTDLMRALRTALQQEGSPGLRADAEHQGAELIELAESCATLDEVLRRLEMETADALS